MDSHRGEDAQNDSIVLLQPRLTDVFGRLFYEGRLKEQELRGLGEDKLKSIRLLARLLAEDAA